MSSPTYKQKSIEAMRVMFEEFDPIDNILTDTSSLAEYARGAVNLHLNLFPYVGDDWDTLVHDVWHYEVFPKPQPKTFDEIAAAQGWNADSQLVVVRGWVDGSRLVTLDEHAQMVADEENEG